MVNPRYIAGSAEEEEEEEVEEEQVEEEEEEVPSVVGVVLCILLFLPSRSSFLLLPDRLDGLVVKASASRAEDPEFESRLPQYVFEIESCQ